MQSFVKSLILLRDSNVLGYVKNFPQYPNTPIPQCSQTAWHYSHNRGYSTQKIVTLFLALLLTGCDTLDQNPQISIDSQEVLTTEDGAESVLIATYAGMEAFLQEEIMFSAVISDEADHTGSFTEWAEFDNINVNPSNIEVEEYWQDVYRMINSANYVLADAPTIAFASQSRLNQLLGEAQALRALGYFYLMRWFGGVPLVTTPTRTLADINTPQRSSEDAVLNFVIDELIEARSLVRPVGPIGFVDSQVIDGLLARVYLYAGQYQEAVEATDALLASGQFTLLEPLFRLYGDPFQDSPGGLNSLESVWEWQDGNGLAFFGFRPSFGGRYEYAPTIELLLAIEENDARGPFIIRIQEGQRVVGKYFRIRDSGDHFFMIRLAEVLLTRAEALVRAGATDFTEPLSIVNLIRNRAFLDPIEVETVTTAEQMLQLILAERRIELAFEGHRWHDLARTDALQSTLGIDPTQARWPIPQGEIDVNPNLTQNAGY